MIQGMATRAVTRSWGPALAGACAVAGPVFILGQCSGARIQRTREVAARLASVESVGRANAASAGERAEDARRIVSRQEKQSRAIQSAPALKPDGTWDLQLGVHVQSRDRCGQAVPGGGAFLCGPRTGDLGADDRGLRHRRCCDPPASAAERVGLTPACRKRIQGRIF